jgi:hypothetical protein
MKATEVLNKFENTDITGLQLSKKKGILTSTWLVYHKNDFFYLFDINDKVEFSSRFKYSKAEILEEFKNSSFEIDCEVE